MSGFGEEVERDLIETGTTHRRRAVTPPGTKKKSATLASSPSKVKDDKKNRKGLEGDYLNVALLLLLYILQGIPLGLSATLDLMLQEKKIPYEQQGVFNSVSWPYSLKILWAPIVDSVFVQQFGRRKSWLVPIQFLIGALLLIAPDWIDVWMGSETEPPHVFNLTALFFTFFFLAATQDVAVDGWAITMLARRNIGYASTTNAIGQSIGFFLAFSGLLAMEYYGVCDLNGFMKFWGVVFVVTTALVALLKHEKSDRELQEEQINTSDVDDVPETDIPVSISEAYGQMGLVLRLKGVQMLLLILFTRAIPFVSSDSLAQRKLIEKGMKKEQVASLSLLLTPLNILLPGVLAKQTANRPMTLFRKAYLPRVGVGLLSLFLVSVAPDFEQHPEMPVWYFTMIAATMVIHSVLQSAQFVAVMAFFSQVSDPSIGGTYMTLLNTMANMGSKLPNFVSVFMLEYLTLTQCDANGENCEVIVDGFVIISIACVIFGLWWYKTFATQLDHLQDMPMSYWSTKSV